MTQPSLFPPIFSLLFFILSSHALLRTYRPVFVLLSLISSALALSSGMLDICNAKSPLFGCNTFQVRRRAQIVLAKSKKRFFFLIIFSFFSLLQDGNRLQCQEPGQVMQWALKPVTDNTMFELFAGEESSKATQYTPGKLIKISLRTKKYDS